jgi:cell division transport system permease protein
MKKGFTQIYSIIGVSLVLFLLGTIGWLVIKGNSITSSIKEQVKLQVIFNDNTRDENITALADILKKQPFTKDLKVVTKEDAAAQMKKELGEDFMVLLDVNPLYTSIDLQLHADYVNADSIAKVNAFISQSNVVREITFDKAVVDKMNDTFRKIGLILGIIAVILFIAVVVVIDNTVRLAMFSNRMLIKTMQMVGATRGFIARPFNKQAVITGLISAGIAIVLLFLLKTTVESNFTAMVTPQENMYIIVLLVVILLLGVLISVFSTQRAVVKYLKLKLDELY